MIVALNKYLGDIKAPFFYNKQGRNGFRIKKYPHIKRLRGELISAVRKNNKSGSIGTGSIAGNIAEELADVFIYVCSIANMHQVDLELAFREKEEKDKLRIWKKL